MWCITTKRTERRNRPTAAHPRLAPGHGAASAPSQFKTVLTGYGGGLAGSDLRNLTGFTGLACVAIGVHHFALGTASVPGAADANATVDSRERLYSAVFTGYGLAWLRAARRSPIRATDVRLLAGLMLFGAVGRLISLVSHGRPHWLQEVLTAIEFVVPAVFFGMADSEEKGRTAVRRVGGQPLLRRNSRRLSAGPCTRGCLAPPSL